MPRRHYEQLERIAQRLDKRLKRLLIYVQTSKAKHAATVWAEAQAYTILNEANQQILDWTRRLTVRRDLHKRNPYKLDFQDEQSLKLAFHKKFNDFKQILKDATA